LTASRAKPLGFTQSVDTITATQLNIIDQNQAAGADGAAGDTFLGAVTLLSDATVSGAGTDLLYGGAQLQHSVDITRHHYKDAEWGVSTDGWSQPVQSSVPVAAPGPDIAFSFTLPDGCDWEGVRVYLDPSSGHADPIASAGATPPQLTYAGYIDITTGTETSLSTAVPDPTTGRTAYEALHSFDVTFGSPVTWDASKHVGGVTVGGEAGAISSSAQANLAITRIEALITPAKWAKTS